jgi:hypothetical protein
MRSEGNRPGSPQLFLILWLSLILVAAAAEQNERAPRVSQRTGAVRAIDRGFVDDGGPFLALGTTLFWALWGVEHDKDRLAQNLETARSSGFDYIRVLAIVGPEHWTDRTVDPRTPNWGSNISALTDWVYDRHQLRIQWTIFGGIGTTPTVESRASAVDRFLKAIEGRHHKVFAIEIANEGEQNGFGGPAGWTEIKALATRVRRSYAGLLATTSPASVDCNRQTRLYAGSPASLRTLHFRRSDEGRNTWQLLEQPWRVGGGSCRGVPVASSSNEPIGPYSSVREERDPAILVTSAALTWTAGIGAYVLHTGAGIRGGGAEDRARGRPANLHDVDGWLEIVDGFHCLRSVLPPDLPDWERRDERDRRHPFSTTRSARDQPLWGAHVAAVKGSRFVTLLPGIRQRITLKARRAATVRAIEPLQCVPVFERVVGTGDSFTLPSEHAAVVILGER